MTIYVVEATCKGGSHWVHSVHTDEAEADKECARINEFYEKQASAPCPFPVDEEGDLIDENISIEDQHKYNNWWQANRDALQWRSAEVEPYETDKAYTEFVSF